MRANPYGVAGLGATKYDHAHRDARVRLECSRRRLDHSFHSVFFEQLLPQIRRFVTEQHLLRHRDHRTATGTQAPHHVPEEPVLDVVSLLFVVAPRRRRQDAIVPARIKIVRQRPDERVTARQIRTIDAGQHESAEADWIGPPVGLDTGDCRRSDCLVRRRGVGRAARPAQRFDQEPAEAEAGIVHLLSRRRVGQRHHEIDNRGWRDELTHRLAMPVHHEAHRLIEHGGGEPAACRCVLRSSPLNQSMMSANPRESPCSNMFAAVSSSR